MPVLCSRMSAFNRPYFSASLATGVISSFKFGRANPATNSRGSRKARWVRMSRRTSGVAVAVNAATCGRPSVSSTWLSRK